VKRLIAFRLGLGPILALAVCSLVAGMIAGPRIAMSAPTAPAHAAGMSARNGAVAMQSCISGFTVSLGDHPAGPKDVYKCMGSVPPACASGYSVQNDQSETTNVITRNPRFDVMLPANGRFVYDCNLP